MEAHDKCRQGRQAQPWRDMPVAQQGAGLAAEEQGQDEENNADKKGGGEADPYEIDGIVIFLWAALLPSHSFPLWGRK